MYTCVQAAHAAYSEHLEPFHNWLLKNTFSVRVTMRTIDVCTLCTSAPANVRTRTRRMLHA